MTQRLTPGQALEGIPAQAWNEFADAAEFIQGLQGAVRLPEPRRRPPLSAVLDEDRLAFEVVGIDEPQATIAEDEQAPYRGPVGFKVISPTTLHAQKFMVLQSGGVAGQVVPAILTGVTWVKIDVQEESDTHAAVSNGDSEKLISGSGPAQILWKESGTGTKWAVVRLSGGTGSLDRSEYVTVRIDVDVPARSGTEAGFAADSGQIVAVCDPTNAGNNPVYIGGLEYDFTSATAGDIVEPESGGGVSLVNMSLSAVDAGGGNKYYATGKYLGEGEGGDDPWYELIGLGDLRTLTGFDDSKDQSLGLDADDTPDEINWQDDGPCDG